MGGTDQETKERLVDGGLQTRAAVARRPPLGAGEVHEGSPSGG
jgi:hypothetical protein